KLVAMYFCIISSISLTNLITKGVINWHMYSYNTITSNIEVKTIILLIICFIKAALLYGVLQKKTWAINLGIMDGFFGLLSYITSIILPFIIFDTSITSSRRSEERRVGKECRYRWWHSG